MPEPFQPLAIIEMNARIRTDAVEDGLPFTYDATFLSRMDTALNLTTRFGDLDLARRPARFPEGFVDLDPTAVVMQIGETEVHVASRDDIIESKRAADPGL